MTNETNKEVSKETINSNKPAPKKRNPRKKREAKPTVVTIVNNEDGTPMSKVEAVKKLNELTKPVRKTDISIKTANAEKEARQKAPVTSQVTAVITEGGIRSSREVNAKEVKPKARYNRSNSRTTKAQLIKEVSALKKEAHVKDELIKGLEEIRDQKRSDLINSANAVSEITTHKATIDHVCDSRFKVKYKFLLWLTGQLDKYLRYQQAMDEVAKGNK